MKSESEVAQSCRFFATPWTAAYQAPPSMGFSRQEYWSGVPLPGPFTASAIGEAIATRSPCTAVKSGPCAAMKTQGNQKFRGEKSIHTLKLKTPHAATKLEDPRHRDSGLEQPRSIKNYFFKTEMCTFKMGVLSTT